MIRQTFHIDPDKLDEEKWCELYAETLYLNKIQFLNLKTAVVSAAAAIFGKDGEQQDTVDS